jgi:2-dehydro-3-deoxyphosphogluconate aldolase/(4S)-4-hydroxy-2-oxoglutarate aldolase
MKRKEIAAVIEQVGIVPAIRVLSADDAHFAAEAVAGGGIPIVEITMTVPGAMDVIAHLVKHHAKLIVGAGTVLDVETARQCADAGAHFLTAPGFDCDIVTFAAEHDIVSMPGALTPTEVVAAWRAGADFVKVFPAVQVGGDGYVRALNRSLPQVSLIASGGVNQQNAEAFIFAGATAIGVGTQLIPTESIEKRQAKRIHELALRFSKFVREARLRLPPRKEVTASASHISAVKCEKP